MANDVRDWYTNFAFLSKDVVLEILNGQRCTWQLLDYLSWAVFHDLHSEASHRQFASLLRPSNTVCEPVWNRAGGTTMYGDSRDLLMLRCCLIIYVFLFNCDESLLMRGRRSSSLFDGSITSYIGRKRLASVEWKTQRSLRGINEGLGTNIWYMLYVQIIKIKMEKQEAWHLN